MSTSVAQRLALAVIRASHRYRIFGPPEIYYTDDFVRPGPDGISPATRREFDDGPSFFAFFEGAFSVGDVAGLDVLDLGCGYGGRAAYCMKQGRPRSVVGLEIDDEIVRIASDSVPRLCDARGVSFAVGVGERLPFASESFDAILSYDVFEHVRDLREVLGECHRVLRPGGRVYALFPPYYGPRAHHLGFVTTFPFLHHVFSPETLVSATNTVLAERPEIGKPPLPPPTASFQHRVVLPSLNGTTERDFRRLVAGLPFEPEQLELVPFAWAPGGRAKALVRSVCKAMLSVPWPFTRDVFVTSIRCVLRKPGPGPFSLPPTRSE
jgi:SAM-dependent methyltransferase